MSFTFATVHIIKIFRIPRYTLGILNGRVIATMYSTYISLYTYDYIYRGIGEVVVIFVYELDGGKSIGGSPFINTPRFKFKKKVTKIATKSIIQFTSRRLKVVIPYLL